MTGQFELARPNEAKVTEYLQNVDADWEDVAYALLAYLSDDDVKDWTHYYGIYDDVYGEDDEDDAEEAKS